MPVVSISQAAKALGFKSRSTLHRLRRQGLLRPFDQGPAGLELEGLREHVAGLLRPDRRRSAELGGEAQGDAPDLLAARERVERLRGDLLELDLAEREGQLVNAGDCHRAYFKVARQARDRLMVLPLQLADVLAACGDREQVVRILTGAIREACQAISDDPLSPRQPEVTAPVEDAPPPAVTTAADSRP